MKVRYGFFGLVLASAVALSACSSDSGSPTGAQGNGSVSIMLTDAPSDSVTAAVVTITDIYLQPGTDSTSTSGRVYLRQNVKTTVNLLQLRDSLKSLVSTATVPAGNYAQLRFVITGAYIQTRNSSGGTSIYATSSNYEGLPSGAQVTGTLVTPSWATSGLKVILPNNSLNVTANSNTSLVADFDLAQSLGHEAGQSGRWIMTPVIKAVNQSATASLTVTVGLGAGVTLPTGVALTGFQVQLTDASGNKRTAPLVLANGQASATFQALVPTNGPYSITLIAPTGFKVATSNPTLPTSITLNGGTNAQVITLTSVTVG